MKRICGVGLMALVVLAAGCAGAQEEQGATIVPTEKIQLFNGRDLFDWKLVVGKSDADPTSVFSARDGVISITGQPSGYMRTLNNYADYKLHAEWRWLPVEGKARRNSGVLVHMSEPDKVWPRSIECQLMAGNAGDFFVIEGSDFKEHKDLVEKAAEQAKGDEGGGKKKAKEPSRRVPKMNPSNEKPIGEWNAYDIVCQGNSIEVRVNGELQNKATETNVSSGKILLQSEGAPVEFRNVYIEPVGAAPNP